MNDDKTSKQVEDGGPAFPTRLHQPFGEGRLDMGGMSLRDYIATAAFQAAMTQASGLGQISKEERATALRTVADICYEAADAMLAARSPS